MPMRSGVHVLQKRTGVDEVSILFSIGINAAKDARVAHMGKDNSIRRIDIKRLSLSVVEAASSGVSNWKHMG